MNKLKLCKVNKEKLYIFEEYTELKAIEGSICE
jgi:hypothetical protein